MLLAPSSFLKRFSRNPFLLIQSTKPPPRPSERSSVWHQLSVTRLHGLSDLPINLMSKNPLETWSIHPDSSGSITKAPRRGINLTRPRYSRLRNDSRTVERAREKLRHNSLSGGSQSPTANTPSEICCSTSRETIEDKRAPQNCGRHHSTYGNTTTSFFTFSL
jgi:hypothetical protein